MSISHYDLALIFYMSCPIRKVQIEKMKTEEFFVMVKTEIVNVVATASVCQDLGQY